MSDINIRRMTAEDVLPAAALERECFPDPWSEKSLRDMLQSPPVLYLAAEADGEVAGYCDRSEPVFSKPCSGRHRMCGPGI